MRVGCFGGSAEGGVFSKPSILLLPGTGGGSYIFFLLLPGIGTRSYTFFSFCCQGQEEEVTGTAATRRRRRKITSSAWKNFPSTAHTDGQTLLPLYIRYCKYTKHISKINSNSNRLRHCKYTIHILDTCVHEFEKQNLQGFNIQNI